MQHAWRCKEDHRTLCGRKLSVVVVQQEHGSLTRYHHHARPAHPAAYLSNSFILAKSNMLRRPSVAQSRSVAEAQLMKVR